MARKQKKVKRLFGNVPLKIHLYVQHHLFTLVFICRACRLWSAPYDGIDPPPQEYRSGTPGEDAEDEEEIVGRVKSDSICSLVITPPPSALSPTPSSSDTVSTSNQAGRASSALELEWDDIFADEDLSLSPMTNAVLSNGGLTSEAERRCTPPLPPRHIQEMRRSATKLVRGSYVEESEFQDDVLVYDLVAQKDTKAAILERIMAANRRARGSISKGQRASTATPTTTWRTVMETVNSIMSTRRRSEDYGKEVTRRRRSEDCVNDMDEEEDEVKEITDQGELQGCPRFANGSDAKNHIIDECDDAEEDGQQNDNLRDISTCNNHLHTTQQLHKPQSLAPTTTLPNGHCESEPSVSTTNAKSLSLPENKVAHNNNNNNFLSQYRELMLSLGVEPDCEDITDDTTTFRKRVQELRQKLEEEEEELSAGVCFSSSQGDAEREEEDEVMEEEEEEDRRSDTDKGSLSRGVPFTGMYRVRVQKHFHLDITEVVLLTCRSPMMQQVLSSASCCPDWRTSLKTP